MSDGAMEVAPRSRDRRLQTYIWGERAKDSGRQFIAETPTGATVALPLLSPEHVAQLRQAPCRDLRDVALGRVLGFLKNVGRNWKSQEYVRRRLYVRDLMELRGYSEKMANNEADWIALLLCADYRLYDALNVELGGWQAVDEWIPREEAYVRALPLGTVLHICPGNVPLSSVISILRAIITKNCSIVKLSSDDPFTPLALVQSFCDVDPTHPVTRSLSVVYWPSTDDPVGAEIAAGADGIIAWGGDQAVAWARKHAGVGTEFIGFGPKRSLGLVAADANLKRAAKAVALDASLYDQRACFSLRQVFVEHAAAAEFRQHLLEALEALQSILPASVHSFDELAGARLSRQQWSFEGRDYSAGDQWAVVVESPTEELPHCLGRTVFIHPVADLAEALDYIDGSVQTVGAMPGHIAWRLREELADRGVARIVELGLHNIFRLGGAHDGKYPLQRMVRWSSHERPASHFVKGINVEIDQTDFLEHDRLVDFIP